LALVHPFFCSVFLSPDTLGGFPPLCLFFALGFFLFMDEAIFFLFDYPFSEIFTSDGVSPVCWQWVFTGDLNLLFVCPLYPVTLQ